jgi:hypothetical protein
MADKFLRSQPKPQTTAWDNPVFRSPLEWYIEHTTYPQITRLNGEQDLWWKFRFRFNSADLLTLANPYFWVELGVGYSYFELEFGKYATNEVEERYYITTFSFPSATGSANPNTILNGRATSPAWPVSGTNTIGPASGTMDALRVFPNWLDRVNELVIEQKRVGDTLVANYYFGEATGSGSLPLVRTVTTGNEPVYINDRLSSYIYFNVISAYNDPFEPMEASFSLDIFQSEFGTGSIPSAALFANSLVSAASGWGTDFSEFNDIEDLINQVRPGSTTYTGNPIFYDGYEGYYVPILYYGPYDFRWLTGTPVSPSSAQLYSEAGGVYYFDKAKFDVLNASLTYEPADGILENPYLILMPTGSRGGVGQMMGPLSVGGSIIPPVIDPEVRINLSSVILKYSTVRAPSTRRGLYLQRTSGSAPLSLEPTWPTSSWHLPGDIWFGDTTGNWRGLTYADYNSPTNLSASITSSIVPYRVFSTTGSRDYLDGGSW